MCALAHLQTTPVCLPLLPFSVYLISSLALMQILSSRDNLGSYFGCKAEILVLKIATKYPSSSSAAAEQLAQEIGSRDGIVDPILLAALREFQESREAATTFSPTTSVVSLGTQATS